MPEDRLLTIPEVAARLGFVSRPPVYRLLRSGDLKSVKVGRARRIRESDLHAYVDSLAILPYAETVEPVGKTNGRAEVAQ